MAEPEVPLWLSLMALLAEPRHLYARTYGLDRPPVKKKSVTSKPVEGKIGNKTPKRGNSKENPWKTTSCTHIFLSLTYRHNKFKYNGNQSTCKLISSIRESQIPFLKTLAVLLITDIYLKQLHRKVSSNGIEKLYIRSSLKKDGIAVLIYG